LVPDPVMGMRSPMPGDQRIVTRPRPRNERHERARLVLGVQPADARAPTASKSRALSLYDAAPAPRTSTRRTSTNPTSPFAGTQERGRMRGIWSRGHAPAVPRAPLDVARIGSRGFACSTAGISR
jgi:hypothetical protein